MPNVNGYTTKRKPHRVRPHFRYPSKTTLLEVERTAETAYLRAYEANMRHPTMRRAAQLVMKANALTEARARSRSFYP